MNNKCIFDRFVQTFVVLHGVQICFHNYKLVDYSAFIMTNTGKVHLVTVEGQEHSRSH